MPLALYVGLAVVAATLIIIVAARICGPSKRHEPPEDGMLVARVRGEGGDAAVWAYGDTAVPSSSGFVSISGPVLLTLTSGRRTTATRLTPASAGVLSAALLALVTDEPEDLDLLRRLHQPDQPGPGGQQT
jgi:hypothetical protein